MADAGLDYDSVMAGLARGLPPMSVLRPGLQRNGIHVYAHAVGGRPPWDLVDDLVAIARSPYLPVEPPDPPAVEWPRLAGDLERSANRRMELTFTWEQWSEDGYWKVGYTLEGSRRGSVMVRWDGLDTEHMLADLADRLCEAYLHEEIWGGWPMCPNHPTTPMWATVSETGQAVWRCGRDLSDEVRIGELGGRVGALQRDR